MVEPGEPYFLPQDTDLAVALAEEERDTCQSCGMPKAWCRNPDNQFAFEPHEEECFATKRIAQHQSGPGWTGKHEDSKRATQLWARFRDGHQPDVEAGLGLEGSHGPEGDAENA